MPRVNDLPVSTDVTTDDQFVMIDAPGGVTPTTKIVPYDEVMAPPWAFSLFDSDFGIPTTVRLIAIQATLTAARVYTLPDASLLPVNSEITVVDLQGSITA